MDKIVIALGLFPFFLVLLVTLYLLFSDDD